MSTPTDTLFSSQWYLGSTSNWGINVTTAWDSFTGTDINIAICDTGIDNSHADLDGQVVVALGYFADTQATTDGTAGLDVGDPQQADDNHGTQVAGLAAAELNGTGIVGVAYDSDLISIYVNLGVAGSTIPSTADSGDFARAFDHAADNADIMNNSWGVGPNFADNFGTGWSTVGASVEAAAETGRGGLGLVGVQAAGNGGDTEGDNTNYHNLGNTRYEIHVASSNRDGLVAGSSTPGASILVSAPGSGQRPLTGGTIEYPTTDRVGTLGDSSGDYFDPFSGTSAAAPLVSGVVALMLDANPNLGYRDVQEILAYSAVMTYNNVVTFTTGRVTDQFDYNFATNWNGGGLHFSHDTGAGLVDATAAVRLAESWFLPGGLAHVAADSTMAGGTALFEAVYDSNGAGTLSENDAIADNSTVWTTETHNVSLATPILIDHVEVAVNIDHDYRGDLIVELQSPGGTTSVLINRPGVAGGTLLGDDSGVNIVFTLSSVQFWGESSNGTWTLRVRDASATPDNTGGTLISWDLRIYGDPTPVDDTYIYTNEFLGITNGNRSTLTDGDGGVDTMNLAAVSSASVVDFLNSTATIDGRTVTISSPIENVIGGDGNDTFIGSTSSNTAWGMRGDDTILSADGLDTLYGGSGNDSLNGGSGNDTQEGGVGADTISGDVGDDLLLGGADFDILVGWDNNDTLYGGDSGDALSGWNGADRFYGGAGTDLADYQFDPAAVLVRLDLSSAIDGYGAIDSLIEIENVYGSAFSDSLFGDSGANVLVARQGDDHAYGGSGVDVIDGGNEIILGAASGNDRLYGGNGSDTVVGFGNNDTLYGDNDDDSVFGTDGTDVVFGGSGNDVMAGDNGNDTLFGGTNNDLLVGGADGGNDSLYGGDNDDVMYGHVGTDVVHGGSGNDLLDGHDDNDSLNGGGEDDLLYGAGGSDTVDGDTGNDTISGGAASDTLNGGDGSDTVAGNEDNDTIDGGLGNDVVLGFDGNDFLQGSSGDDAIDGAAGNDTISGGDDVDVLFGRAGTDTLTGGSENDFFVVDTADGVGTDTVTDFTDDQDTVDLVGLSVSSGIGTGTVILSNGSTIISSGGHLWESDDFS